MNRVLIGALPVASAVGMRTTVGRWQRFVPGFPLPRILRKEAVTLQAPEYSLETV
ncbi:hypothetical protein ABT010_34415 [Streptomyces sp. NPDC002668]|uniref:hypothetical protein n=1 Tax=Streptomyces sp. NPDC002668 TaxID=3154422 RepID=UPI00332C2B1D